MAAPSPATSSPTSTTSTGSAGSANTGLFFSPTFTSQMLGSSSLTGQLLSGQLAQALQNPLATSSPTGTGAQSKTETTVGWIASGLLVVAGLFFMAFGSPKTIRLVGTTVAAPAAAP